MRIGAAASNLLLLIWLLLLAGALVAVHDIARRASTAASVATVAQSELRARSGCLPSDDGFLRMRLRDAYRPALEIDWKNADMRCEGGLRPDLKGMRMMFAGPLTDGHRLRVVFGVSAPAHTTVAHNVPTNVTVIFEDEQKLFSTAGDSKCTIDALTLQQPAQQSSTGAVRAAQRYLARGFCTEPATSVTGTETLLIDRFDFAGDVLDEDQP